MFLFHLGILKDASSLFTKNYLNSSHIQTKSKSVRSSNLFRKQLLLTYVFKTPEALSISKDDLAKKNLERQPFDKNLLNNWWQQEIFLSMNSKSLNKYNLELNSLTLHKGQNLYKSLLTQFSKSLFDGSIQSSLFNTADDSLSNSPSIQYLWAKSIKRTVIRLNDFFEYPFRKKRLQNIDTLFTKKVNLQYLPIFTVSNHLDQIIIAEPSTELKTSSYFYNCFSQSSNDDVMHYGFFFMNYQDAQEYLTYVRTCYNLGDEKLKISTSNFSAFYKKIKKFDSKICFRLIPDLKEVSDLIKQYRYYRNLSFHKNQKYGSSYFQGQPLYIISNKNNINKLFQHDYLIFTSYKDATSIYHNIIPSAKRPVITTYNLEQFIKEQIENSSNELRTFLAIPSKESYLFTKQSQLKNRRQLLHDSTINIVAWIKLWSKRVLWSLTSRKPGIDY